MPLAGCSVTPRLKFEIVSTTIPDDLRHCRNAPGIPKKPYTQKDVAKFVNSLSGAYLDCKVKLAGVLKIVDQTNAAADAEAKRASKN